jgi:cytochrome P450
MTPKFAKFVTMNVDFFISKGAQSLMNLLGPKMIMSKNGPANTSLKKLLLKPILPEALRSLVANIEILILENMGIWEQTGTVVAKDVAEKVDFQLDILLSF